MSKTREFLVSQIADNVAKALGLPVASIQFCYGNEIHIVVNIEGQNADSLFWRAVREQRQDVQVTASNGTEVGQQKEP